MSSEKYERRTAMAGALTAAGAAFALFGGVGVGGVAFPLVELPASSENIADTLAGFVNELSGTVTSITSMFGISAIASGPLSQLQAMQDFLTRLSSGDLAQQVVLAVVAHVAIVALALLLGLVAARRCKPAAAFVGALLVAIDAAAVWYVCGYANTELTNAVASLQESGVLDAEAATTAAVELSPTMGMWAAALAALLAVVACVAALVAKKRS